MSGDRLDLAKSLCREAAEQLGDSGSFRLRVLLQMILLELEKERAARSVTGPGASRG